MAYLFAALILLMLALVVTAAASYAYYVTADPPHQDAGDLAAGHNRQDH